MLKFNNIIKEFNGLKLLDNINFFISPNDKIGLVGANGVGKSTLMKIIIGNESYDSGSIYIAPHTNITYLGQELPEINNNTLIEEVKTIFSEIYNIKKELNNIEYEIEKEKNDKILESLLNTYTTLQEEIHNFDLNKKEAEIEKILKGLGFSEKDFYKETKTFSGGWQMRISLAKLLLQKPNLLLLDEPTNHLDISAIEWLEEYIKNYDKAIMIISHDKRFLDNIVNKIFELENKKLTEYSGNYSKYEIEKEKRLEELLSAKERQDKEIEKLQTFIDRFKAKATKASQAKSKEKMLDRIEIIEIPKNPKKINFKFPIPNPSGKIVLKINKIKKSFGNKKIFDFNNELWIKRGDKIALIGPNGSGKSTLVKLIMNIENLDFGNIEIGHNVTLNYYSQKQSEELNNKKEVIDEIYDEVPNYTLTQVRSLLGKFLFQGEKVFQEISLLSGGEKSRLALAKMLLKNSNFLILDEPTNHLDIPSKEVLINALQEFPETLLIISHDRDFISRVCNKIFEIDNYSINSYEGNYDYYIEEKKKNQNNQSKNTDNIKSTNNTNLYILEKEKKKKINSLEKEILKLEEKIKILENKLNDNSLYEDKNKFLDLTNEYNNNKSLLDKKYQEWESFIL